ncbi:hypothetical protein [Paenibacillus sp.]|uniref:hypothetical protein n=1 Tax=Paenibacillus sp. TaxID=58172 RepID=UPI002D576FE1|nr:hypothetical protein [Paenibacillus sp.]HZG85736.1 hypothetical protein [Paenibacillus sp.]
MNVSQRHPVSLEESIRQVYNRVERETAGAASSETHVLIVENKVVVVARGLPVDRRPVYEETLRSEFAAELGCSIESVRTRVSLAEDEKMEIFILNRPLQ